MASKCQVFFCSTWKCQVFFTVRKLGRIGTPGPASGSLRAKRGTLSGFFSIHCCQISKNKGRPFGFKEISKKILNAKKLKGGPFGFFNIYAVAKHRKNWSGTLWRRKISKKVNAEKRGDPLVSPGIVCYAEKEGKPFWFTSLGQMIQFGTIKFRGTFKNYFGQFLWIEKKVTIIVAFYFMKRRLKNDIARVFRSNRLPLFSTNSQRTVQ